jgi:BirA family transcriptional regulator, biotin operon repressor / biotin---[acetyl-CoA-carboxylase] ligase
VKRASVIRASLDEGAISAQISSNYWRVRVVPEVGSTQDELKNELVSNGDCVVAEFQSAGRGRLDRKFDSAPNVALLFSFFIKPGRTSQWGWIPLIAGMSVAQTLNEAVDSDSFTTKWPNDVLATSGKAAGILCERYGEGIIVGIGINVSTQVDELPVETATSIFIETGVELNRNDLLAALLKNFQILFDRWESGEDLIPKYRALSATIGQQVRVVLPHSATIEGVAIGVNAEGELILESGDRINVGDVVHLR